MHRGVFIVIIIVVLVAVGFFMFPRGAEEEGTPTESHSTAYFAEEIKTDAVARFGQPIEGFEPQMLIQAFPGLQHTDFDGVEAEQGVFQVSNGALAFVLIETPEHSAARVVTQNGMEQLLQNVAARLQLPFETESDVDAIIETIRGEDVSEMIVGLWESTDDDKFTREFLGTGTVTDRYEGDEFATSVGTWELLDSLSGEPISTPAAAGATYLKIVFSEEVLYFTVSEVLDDTLQLIFLDRGGALNFTRMSG